MELGSPDSDNPKPATEVAWQTTDIEVSQRGFDQHAVKRGYKQTEVGVIPEDWDIANFDEIGRVVDGDRGINYPSDDDFYGDGYCLFLSAKNVTKQGFLFRECSFISKERDQLLNKGRLNRNDIVLTTRGTVGNLAYFDSSVEYENVRINSGMVILRNESRLLETDYLYVFLRSQAIQCQIERLVFGSAQPQLTVKGICKFKVLIPPPQEQRAIATVLSDMDALLARLDALIGKKRDLKQAAMQQLLTGNQRLPGFSGEWEVRRLEEVADIDGDNLGSNTEPGYQFKYISLEDVDCGTLRGFTELTFRSAPSRARRKVIKGDVLVSTVRPNLKSHLVFQLDQPNWICSTGFSVVRCKKHVAHPGYVFFHLFGGYISEQVDVVLTGSNYPAINSQDVKSLKFPMPSFEEQTAIAVVLSDMDAEIAALKARRDKTRALKQGMMQELLTGRIRLT